MAFQFKNEEVYNVYKKDNKKSSNAFKKVYEVAKIIVAERDERIIELVFGTYKDSFFNIKELRCDIL